jgi:uncharacterized membrane protein
MEKIEENNPAVTTINGKEIINSSFVKPKLQEHTLKEVLGSLTEDSLPQSTTNPLEKVQEAIGITQSIQVEKTVIIERPQAELYDYWRDFTNLPKFMGHLRSVTPKDESGIYTHWVANAPLNNTVKWDAKIVIEEPHNLIAWSALENADIDNCGFVRFQPATGNRGTEVKVVLEYKPLGGNLTDALAKLFGESPQQQIGDELNRFKQLMETGEISINKGQPQGV